LGNSIQVWVSSWKEDIPSFRWEEMGFYREENLSSGKKLPRVTNSVTTIN